MEWTQQTSKPNSRLHSAAPHQTPDSGGGKAIERISISRRPTPPLALRPSPKLLTERQWINAIFTVSGRGLLTTHEVRADPVADQGQEIGR
jgi:hypothetical protein